MIVCSEYLTIVSKTSSRHTNTLSAVRRHLSTCTSCTSEGAVNMLVEAAFGTKAKNSSGMIARSVLSSMIMNCIPHRPMQQAAIAHP